MSGVALSHVLLILTYSGFTGLGLLWLWPVRRANPCFWFLILQWIIAAGSIRLADLSLTADLVYISLYFFSVVAFLAGAFVASKSFDTVSSYEKFYRKPVQFDVVETRIIVAVIVILSIVVTIAYYRAVGYNVLVNLILREAIEDVTSARLAAYSGDQYFAPGYANQFKNVLLPLGMSILAATAWQQRRRGLFRLILIAGLPAVVLGLLGTGQRGFFVYAFVAFLFGLSMLVRFKKTHFAIASVLVIVLFGLMSAALGRIDDFSAISVVGGVLSRVFVNDQIGGITGFRYVYPLDTVWFSQWADGILGILPNHKGSDFDHYMHYLLHGTARGTSTPTTVTSTYYNGGFLGIASVYLCMGWTYSFLYYRFLNGPRTVFRCFTYGALFFHLSFFVAGAPASLINKGVVTLLLMLIIGKLRVVKQVRSTVTPMLATESA